MKNTTLEEVTLKPDLWKSKDPVRPSLGVSFKTYPGRKVFGLKAEDGTYVAFCCVARAWDVPVDIMSLSSLTTEEGPVCVPYTVWSHRRGAGKTIINKLLNMLRESDAGIKRVVTLSPRTEMARNFHLRNGAKEISVNVVTANFEYKIYPEEGST